MVFITVDKVSVAGKLYTKGDRYTCSYCLKVKTWKSILTKPSKDHFIPKSRGGGNGDNIILCCPRCNNIKGDKIFNTIEELREFIKSKPTH